MSEALSKKPRILIIEDNPDTRQIYRDVFERDGFQVLIAEDGEKGLSHAKATLPDVILLDLMLPKLSGFDLLACLRDDKETSRIPVMVFSALGDPADRRRAADLGVTEYTMKAVTPPRQAVGRVRALLAKLALPASSDFTVALKASSEDSKRLQLEMGLKNGFSCPKCSDDIAVRMIPDPTKTQGRWFTAQLICAGCRQIF